MRLVVWEFYSRTTIGDAGSSRSPRPMYFMGRVIAISLQENHRREKQVTGYVRLMPQGMVSRGGPELAKHLASSVRSFKHDLDLGDEPPRARRLGARFGRYLKRSSPHSTFRFTFRARSLQLLEGLL